MKNGVFILGILSGIFHCSTETGYISNPFGARLYESPSIEAKAIGSLYWPEKVKYRVLEESNFAEIALNGKQGYILQSNLAPDPAPFFLKTVAPLNLRSEPTATSKVLLVIKKHEILPIKAASKVFEVIDNRRGNWLETEIQGQKGWVFSGYVLVDKSPEKLQSEELSQLGLKFLPEHNRPPEYRNKAIRVEKIFENERYIARIYHYDAAKMEKIDMGLDLESQFIVEFKGIKKYLYEPHQATFRIKPKTSRHPNFLIAEQRSCIRCCADVQTVFFTFGREEVSYFSRWGGSTIAMYCDTYDPEPKLTTKVSRKEKWQFVLWEYEKCLDKEYKKANPPEIHHAAFLRIDFNADSPQIDYLPKSGIPEKYKAEWSMAGIPLS